MIDVVWHGNDTAFCESCGSGDADRYAVLTLVTADPRIEFEFSPGERTRKTVLCETCVTKLVSLIGTSSLIPAQQRAKLQEAA